MSMEEIKVSSSVSSKDVRILLKSYFKAKCMNRIVRKIIIMFNVLTCVIIFTLAMRFNFIMTIPIGAVIVYLLFKVYSGSALDRVVESKLMFKDILGEHEYTFKSNGIETQEGMLRYEKVTDYYKFNNIHLIKLEKRKLIIKSDENESEITDALSEYCSMNEKLLKNNRIRRLRNHFKFLKTCGFMLLMIVVQLFMIEFSIVDYAYDEGKVIKRDIEDNYSVELELIDNYNDFSGIKKYIPYNAIKITATYRASLYVYDIMKMFPAEFFDEVQCKNFMGNGTKVTMTEKNLGKKGNMYVTGLTVMNDEDMASHIYINIYWTSFDGGQTFAHELYHFLDFIIMDNGDSEVMEEYKDWNMYNTKDFKYAFVFMDKVNEPDEVAYDGKYTVLAENDMKNVYFVSDYSKSSEYEDRAEIFSSIVNMNHYESFGGLRNVQVLMKERFYDGLESPNVKKKVQKMSEVLEENFPAIKDSVWQENVSEIMKESD